MPASKLVRLEVESMSEAQLVRFLLPDTPANTRGLSLLETLRTIARQRLADTQQERLVRENKMYVMELLPNNPVILERIFSHLDPSDIKTAALVCRAWNTVLESPKYWTWATVSLGRSNFRQVFYSKRFRIIGGVKLEYYEDRRNQRQLKLFLSRARRYNLTRLDADDNDLSTVSARLLSQVVVYMNEVNLDAADLGYFVRRNHAMESIMRIITDTKRLRLKKLTLGSNLCRVPENLLALALTRMEELDLSNVHMLREQWEALLLRILDGGPEVRLRKLSVRSSFLLYSSVRDPLDIWDTVNTVQPESWAGAIIRLEEVVLPRLSYIHLGVVFTVISECLECDLKLKKLNIDEEVYLEHIPPEVLSSAILRLEEVNLMLTNMTEEQVQSLCMKILENDKLRLKTLKVGQTHKLLALPHVMVEAVRRKVDLRIFTY